MFTTTCLHRSIWSLYMEGFDASEASVPGSSPRAAAIMSRLPSVVSQIQVNRVRAAQRFAARITYIAEVLLEVNTASRAALRRLSQPSLPCLSGGIVQARLCCGSFGLRVGRLITAPVYVPAYTIGACNAPCLGRELCPNSQLVFDLVESLAFSPSFGQAPVSLGRRRSWVTERHPQPPGAFPW